MNVNKLIEAGIESCWVTLLPKHMPRKYSHVTIGAIYQP